MKLFKKNESLLDIRTYNNPECMGTYLDNHSIHTNGSKNIVTEDDIGSCIIFTRLTYYELSEVRAIYPNYNSIGLLRFANLTPPEYVVI